MLVSGLTSCAHIQPSRTANSGHARPRILPAESDSRGRKHSYHPYELAPPQLNRFEVHQVIGDVSLGADLHRLNACLR